MSDELKSAFELAMEKLAAADGADEPRLLDPSQRARIGEIRAEAKAKLAELEIMHKAELIVLLRKGDAEALAKAGNEYELERARIREQEAARVEAVRSEASGESDAR